MPSAMTHVATARDCLNCGARLEGEYCSRCGQKASLHLGFGHVLHEAVHEFIHLDGKIFETIKVLVLRPGRLTKDFVEGRRARYISPIRIYLTFSFLFFLLAATVPGARQAMMDVTITDDAGIRQPLAGAQATAIRNAFLSGLPRMIFVSVPLFALLTWLFFRKAQPYFFAHFYYAVHFVALAFLILSLQIIARYAGMPADAASFLVFVAIAAHHVFGLHRFFAEPWPGTIWKSAATGVLYLLVLLLGLFVVIVNVVSGTSQSA